MKEYIDLRKWYFDVKAELELKTRQYESYVEDGQFEYAALTMGQLKKLHTVQKTLVEVLEEEPK